MAFGLTERSKEILRHSRLEARKLESEFVGTEHLFLGILAEGGGVAAKVLKNLAITYERLWKEVHAISIPSTNPTKILAELPLSPHAKRALDRAEEIAAALGHDVIGTEHILLGLLKSDNTTLFSAILTNMGVRAEEVRDLIYEILGADVEQAPKPEKAHFVSASCQGVKCRICSLPSTHKLGEEIPHDDPLPGRHNLTAYVCCAHFMEIVGPAFTGPCRET